MRGFTRQAKIRFEDGNFAILEAGNYVLCAVTGVEIPLDQLKYWSVDRQEAYATTDAAMKRHLEVTK